jgi:phosphate transport system substrate-binding protein
MFSFRSRVLQLAAVLPALFLHTPAQADPIQGAGSTFAAPAVHAWAQAYKAARTDGGDFTSPDWTVDYEPVGSLGGLMRLGQPELDFAATDAALPPEELKKRGLKQFPVVMGAVAVVANPEGVATGTLRLNGAVLADIYLGKIKTWNDAAIVALNPDLKLPETAIAVQTRSDGSGTTQGFTEYLSAASTEWLNRHGANLLINWSAGQAHKGTQGVIKALRDTKGAIGYVDAGQAARAGLPVVKLANAQGVYVLPSAEAVSAAASSVTFSAEHDFYTQLTGKGGAGAYPITLATFALVPTQGRDAKRIGRVIDLFGLAFENGAEAAAKLGYVPLPPALIKDIRAYWSKNLGARS